MEKEVEAPPTKLVIATRLHLGRASSPPSDDKLTELIGNFLNFATNISKHEAGRYSVIPVIAVDATPKIDGYDYTKAVQDKTSQLEEQRLQGQNQEEQQQTRAIHVLPVTPWGKFVPALNALISYSSEENGVGAKLLLFVSAEVTASPITIQSLCDNLMEDYDHTLVVGAAMNGHLYHESSSSPSETSSSSEVELSGRTCPWNTLAVWNVSKLKLTGFVLCSDLGSTAGVEECAAIALQQQIFGKSNSRAKLVKLNEISWKEKFDDDERRKWHEQKMNSKLERAGKQLEMMTFSSGSVIHC